MFSRVFANTQIQFNLLKGNEFLFTISEFFLFLFDLTSQIPLLYFFRRDKISRTSRVDYSETRVLVYVCRNVKKFFANSTVTVVDNLNTVNFVVDYCEVRGGRRV